MLNAEAFQDQGDKPVVEERGPYTFRWQKFKIFMLWLRQVEKKVNLVWHPDQTVSYQRKKFYYFEREMSVGPLDDTVGHTWHSGRVDSGDVAQPPDGGGCQLCQGGLLDRIRHLGDAGNNWGETFREQNHWYEPDPIWCTHGLGLNKGRFCLQK